MSFTQFLRTLWARRWIVLICAAACTLGGIIGVMLLPRTYTAEARVMLDVGSADPVTGETISSNFARSYLPTQAELIKDSSVSGRVVDRLGMVDSGEAKEDGGTADLRRRLAQEVSDATNAYPVENSNVIVIEYRASDPRTAAKMANAVRDAYAEQSLAAKREAAIKSALWFENQAGQLRGQLQAAEAKKAAFERENNIVLLDDGTDADTARLQSLSGSVDAPQVATTGGAGGSGELAQMDAKIAAALQTLGPNHPQVQELRAQRAALAASARSGGTSTVVTGPSISSQVAGARARVLAQRGKTEEARRLFTDVKVIQDQYSKLVGRAADLRQAAASNASGVTLLDSAIAPSTPSSPKIPQILIGSIALGFILGLLLAIVTELLARRVRGQEDVESLGVPLIGIIAGKAGVRQRFA